MTLNAVPPLKSDGALLRQCDKVSIDELIRSLLLRLSRDIAGLDPDESESERILLDTTIDGRRYLFVRMPAAEPSVACLSPREHEIVRMIAKGYPTKVIADVLNISVWTVCTHLRRIFAKLGVASRTAMLARLLKEGWVWDRAYVDTNHSQPAMGTTAAAPSRSEFELEFKRNPRTERSQTNGTKSQPHAMQKRREAERIF